MDNPVFADPFMFKLWALCLFKASHQPHEMLVGRQVVNLDRGQFVTGRLALATDYNKDMKKNIRVNEYTLWRWLQTLESMQMLHIKSHNKFSVVTIDKYDIYNSVGDEDVQQFAPQMHNSCTSNAHQMHTNNNGNKGNNDNKGKKKDHVSSGEYTREFEEFWSAYPRRISKRGAFKTWNTRLKEGVDITSLVRAAKNYSLVCEKNGTEERFIQHPSTFLGPSKKYEDYIDISNLNLTIIQTRTNVPQKVDKSTAARNDERYTSFYNKSGSG